jgi:hypothetical protein
MTDKNTASSHLSHDGSQEKYQGSPKLAKARDWARTAVLAALLLTLATQDADAQKKKAPPKKVNTSRKVKVGSDSTIMANGVDSTKASFNNVTVNAASDIHSELDSLGYPFTLKIFDGKTLALDAEKLAELKNFFENDLQDPKKQRQIQATWLRGDRESRKALFLKKIENIV